MKSRVNHTKAKYCTFTPHAIKHFSFNKVLFFCNNLLLRGEKLRSLKYRDVFFLLFFFKDIL